MLWPKIVRIRALFLQKCINEKIFILATIKHTHCLHYKAQLFTTEPPFTPFCLAFCVYQTSSGPLAAPSITQMPNDSDRGFRDDPHVRYSPRNWILKNFLSNTQGIDTKARVRSGRNPDDAQIREYREFSWENLLYFDGKSWSFKFKKIWCIIKTQLYINLLPYVYNYSTIY